jgi:hypothetical protein
MISKAPETCLTNLKRGFRHRCYLELITTTLYDSQFGGRDVIHTPRSLSFSEQASDSFDICLNY